MEDYVLSDLETECLLIVVTSTFGNGDSPGNGEVRTDSLLALELHTVRYRLAKSH